MEFCTKCGNFFEYLEEFSGWCYGCADKPDPNNTSPAYWTRWIEINADAIENIIGTKRVSLTVAIKEIRSSRRPKCLICGRAIKGGSQGRTNFCSKTASCKSAQRRYRTLREGAAHLPAAVALEQIVREMT